ncbi:cytochrome p450 [Gymnopilus junonius]|uniref:Cytochrome p450 n=1 Tax=Gymnopilus junonius TaxID=109634 RepID=A0A9P5TL37_GYMJU|nr:cytochrome p450 [Gymnopilus junonius]
MHWILPLSVLTWVSWKLFRVLVQKSGLDNIAGPPAVSFWTGVYRRVFHLNAWGFHREMAIKYGGVIKIKALFGETQLYIFDPKAVHQIFNKDHHIFDEMESFTLICRLILGDGLFGTHGEQHRKQRRMLQPIFSPTHLRDMVPTFYDVAYTLRNALNTRMKAEPKEMEILSWMSRTALEVIGRSGLGYSFDSFTEDNAPHLYAQSAKQIMPFLFKSIILQRYLLVPLSKIGTPGFRKAIINVVPWKDLHSFRSVVDIMQRTSLDILTQKKRALVEGDKTFRQVGQEKDVMGILLNANMEVHDGDKLSDEELIGQINTLTFAATETISGLMGRILSVLAAHQDCQDKLRQEVVYARSKCGDLSYDDLMSLPYLDAVCRETLRVYPPGTTVVRVARADTILALSKPIKGLDGQKLNEIYVPKNSKVIVSILAGNCNPEVWGKDSYEWKPERWLGPLPETVTETRLPGVYSHMMTFLAGNRSCIGFKFAELEMKVIISILIESFRFFPSGKKVVWHMHGVVRPVVPALSDNTPQLPLIIEKLE